MDRDLIVRMTRDSKGEEIFVDMEDGRALFYMSMENLERFAQLVAAQAAAEEREACAQLVRDMGFAGWDMPTIADRIRNRGTA